MIMKLYIDETGLFKLPKQGFCTNENVNILYFDKYPGLKTAYYVFTN